MNSGGVFLILVLLSPVVLSTPLQLKGAPLLLRSQFLSQDEIERAIVRLENGDQSEYGELMETEERSEDGETTLTLRSEAREIELNLKPNYRLIQPFARLTIMDGDDEHESFFDPSLRSSLYHGSVSGSPNGMVSLVRNKDGWNGMIMTEEQRYIVHGVQGSSRALLLPMSTEDEEVYNGYRFLEAEDRAQEYNMTGDESFSRSSDSEFELELGVYTDEDLYTFVKSKYPNANTKQKVEEVVLITLNTVHTFYQKPSIGNKIAVVVASMTVMTSNPSGLNKNNKMETYLDNYCNWDSENKNPGGANYDFGLLFSGIDMYGDTPKDTGTLGMAPVSRTCLHNTKRSCAIGEALGFGSGIIMAHEIGHNLGMLHDSSDNSCPGKGYIMGAMISAGATTFSSCSRKYLKDYLKSLDNFGVNCMRDKGNAAMEHSIAGKLPGERLPKDEQCRYALGEGWTEYKSRQDFCAQLLCRKGNSWDSPTGGPPLPGTPCGTGKVCWDGRCSDRNSVEEKIKAYTPTKSGSSGKALPLDKLCRRKAPQYPTAVTYERTQKSNVRYPDISNMCSEGMICQSNNPIKLMRIAYPAPPGTSCAAGKICKNFACVGSGSSGSSTGSSGGSTGSSGGSSGSSGGSTGSSGGSNSGTGGSSGGSSNTGESSASLDQFCQKTLNSGSAKGQESQDCRQAKCRLGNTIYTIPVYNRNVCKSGQICDKGSCVADTDEERQGQLSGSVLDTVNGLCKRHKGSQYTALCTRENMFMYPNYDQYCEYDICNMVMCVGDNGGGSWSISSVNPLEGESCGNGKFCHWYQCQ